MKRTYCDLCKNECLHETIELNVSTNYVKKGLLTGRIIPEPDEISPLESIFSDSEDDEDHKEFYELEIEICMACFLKFLNSLRLQVGLI
jgi:hypothetical protein